MRSGLFEMLSEKRGHDFGSAITLLEQGVLLTQTALLCSPPKRYEMSCCLLLKELNLISNEHFKNNCLGKCAQIPRGTVDIKKQNM